MAGLSKGVAAYISVTAAYWAFMLTDGALRMLVLLHFHALGFSPVELAYLFLLYELMGIVTNLSAGWVAARFGMASTLYAGLVLQIAALIAMAMLDPGWTITASVVFVMAVQGLSGVAKDLAKTSAKSAVKVLAPSGEGGLFKWVALLTGSKNAFKGLGFLLGAVLLGTVGFVPSVLGMAAALGAILLAVALFMPDGLPPGAKGVKFREVFSKDPSVNRLSLARLFLFGARDAWFVVGIPIFFYSVLSDGTEAGNRAAFFQIGAFMAVWTIGYGAVQAYAPRLLKAKSLGPVPVSLMVRDWVGRLALVVLALTVIAASGLLSGSQLALVLVAGLLIFGAVFAVNSSVHSYFILALTSAERVTMDVGFYYMSNAAGRLLGTLLSGLSYQIGGVPGCLAASAILAALSWLSSVALTRTVREPTGPVRRQRRAMPDKAR